MAQSMSVINLIDVLNIASKHQPLDDTDLSVIETVLGYVEANELDKAAEYVSTLSEPGMFRAARNLLITIRLLGDDMAARRSKTKE